MNILLLYIVKPKKGKALLWPSTLDQKPENIDTRTMHEAKVVIKGLKYAANYWIHLYNFLTPYKWGCIGMHQNSSIPQHYSIYV